MSISGSLKWVTIENQCSDQPSGRNLNLGTKYSQVQLFQICRLMGSLLYPPENRYRFKYRSPFLRKIVMRGFWKQEMARIRKAETKSPRNFLSRRKKIACPEPKLSGASFLLIVSSGFIQFISSGWTCDIFFAKKCQKILTQDIP